MLTRIIIGVLPLRVGQAQSHPSAFCQGRWLFTWTPLCQGLFALTLEQFEALNKHRSRAGLAHPGVKHSSPISCSFELMLS